MEPRKWIPAVHPLTTSDCFVFALLLFWMCVNVNTQHASAQFNNNIFTVKFHARHCEFAMRHSIAPKMEIHFINFLHTFGQNRTNNAIREQTISSHNAFIVSTLFSLSLMVLFCLVYCFVYSGAGPIVRTTVTENGYLVGWGIGLCALERLQSVRRWYKTGDFLKHFPV